MTLSRLTHIEHVLVEITSLLVDRARGQLEREVETAGENTTDQHAVGDLRRLQELEKQLRAIRREFGLHESHRAAPSPTGPQVSKFYEVPGQEDA
jgi:hypothetical protein